MHLQEDKVAKCSYQKQAKASIVIICTYVPISITHATEILTPCPHHTMAQTGTVILLPVETSASLCWPLLMNKWTAKVFIHVLQWQRVTAHAILRTAAEDSTFPVLRHTVNYL